MKIRLYKVNLEYIKFLYYNYDKRVQYNELKSEEYNKNRPYIGIVLNIDNKDYFAPLEHPRPQHHNLKSNPHIIKIKDGKYGIIGLNNMIPIHTSQLIDFDINKEKNKDVLITQFIFCQKNYKLISDRATEIYTRRTEYPNSFEKAVYCDFKKLEEGYMAYSVNNNLESKRTSNTALESNIHNVTSISDRIKAAKQLSNEQVAITKEKSVINERDI